MQSNFEYKYKTIFTKSRFRYYANYGLKTVLLITITVQCSQTENIMKCPTIATRILTSDYFCYKQNISDYFLFNFNIATAQCYYLCFNALHKKQSKTNSTNTEFRNDFSQFVFKCHFHGFPSTGLIYPHSLN